MEITGIRLFFTLPNSWVLIDYFSRLIELLVVVVFILRLVCRVKDFSPSRDLALKGLDRVLMLIRVFSFFFFITRRWLRFYFFYECTLIPTLWMIMK